MIFLVNPSPLRKIWRWGMDTPKDILEFLKAVLKQWLFLLGIVPILLTYFFPRLKKHISERILKIIAIICLSVAVFLAWQVEHHEREKIESQQAVAKLPFDLQIQVVKDRIKYLKEYLKVDIMSLVEVTGTYGNHFLGNTDLYDWDKVMIELERQKYIKIIKRKGKNIIFKVLN